MRSGEDPVREAPASSSSSSPLLPPPLYFNYSFPSALPSSLPHPARAAAGWGQLPREGRGEGRGEHPRSPSPSSEARGPSHTLSASHPYPTALLDFPFLHRPSLQTLLCHLSPLFTSSGLGLRKVGDRGLGSRALPRLAPQ